MRGTVALAALLVLMGGVAQAAEETDADVFDKFVGHSAPECVDMENIAAVATVTQLGERQFEFVRALYVALPPVSRTLPSGTDAYKAESSGQTMLFLAEQGKACVRFIVPDFLEKMLDEVGKGKVIHMGDPT